MHGMNNIVEILTEQTQRPYYTVDAGWGKLNGISITERKTEIFTALKINNSKK